MAIPLRPSKAGDRHVDSALVPEHLYHYTSTQGLIGIVKELAWHATDVEFMNDAQEGQYGRRELFEALDAEATRLRTNTVRGSEEDSRAGIIRSAMDHLYPGGAFAARQYFFTYACCFCEGKDLLGQWRGYGGPGGYSLGFRTSDLLRSDLLAPNEHGQVQARLVQVGYGESGKADMISRVVATIAPRGAGHPGSTGYARAESVVLPELSTVKHGAFAEEREWRILRIAGNATDYRAGSLGPTPFLRLPFLGESIAEVVIGPGANPDIRRRAVERLLDSSGLSNVSVTLSDAPYRP
jgi:hypothetical protein